MDAHQKARALEASLRERGYDVDASVHKDGAEIGIQWYEGRPGPPIYANRCLPEWANAAEFELSFNAWRKVHAR
jgi:hypothetical protein